jgi:predicted DNA binding CopG/RHH family protein
MRDEYDFSQSVPNPYLKKLKKQVTIRLEEDVVNYFKQLSEEVGIPYQSLINLYLQDCVRSERKPSLDWVQT